MGLQKNKSDNTRDLEPRYSSWELLKDIFRYIAPYQWRFIFGSFIRLLGDLANLIPPFALASLVTFATQYKAGQSLRIAWIFIGLWFLANVIRNLSQFFAKSLGYYIAEKISIDSTLRAVQHLFKLDMAWHERENSGNKLKRIQNAGDGLNKIVRLWFNSIIEIVVNLIAINIIIAGFDRVVLVCLILFLATYFVCSGFLTRKAGKAAYHVNIEDEQVNGLVFEAINNIRTVKVMGMARSLFAVLENGTEKMFKKIRLRIFAFQSRESLLSSLSSVWKLGIIVLIIYGISQGHYAVGFLVLFNSYFSDLRESIDELSTATQDFVTSKLSIARLKAILNEPIRIDSETNKVAFSSSWKKISVKNVSFSYDTNTVLKDVTFDIHRGEKVGIVGLSGAGKSTFFKLLLKERDGFSGDITFDNESIKNIRRSDYFQHVSVVLQDTEVFNFSLRDNIIITNPGERNNSKLLNRSLAIAHISDFVEKLPNGIDTIIGEKGIKLSGGERQRLGIARAIFKEPELLLLDEATSHLDLESEEKIRDSLHEFFENVTAVVIAHRLTTIREMDKILVLENGRIVESGTFESLYAAHGRFFELWEKQKL